MMLKGFRGVPFRERFRLGVRAVEFRAFQVPLGSFGPLQALIVIADPSGPKDNWSQACIL